MQIITVNRQVFNIKEDYLITVNSVQKTDDSDSNQINVTTTGKVSQVAGKKYITYREFSEDSPRKSSLCTIKIENDNFITITHGTSKKSRLVFEQGRRHYCPYPTEYGVIMFGLFTNKISYDFSEKEVNLKLKYSLDMNASFVSSHEITITAAKTID